MKKPLVAIVGRPNVGKSTLFNRIVGERQAIVEDVSGVTRDRNYATATWNDRPFVLVDTGGIVSHTDEEIPAAIRHQAMLAIDEADSILFVLDGQNAPTADDLDISERLRVSGKPVFHVINKIDGPRHEQGLADFYTLGPDRLYTVSSLHGRGVDDLLDEIVGQFPAPADGDDTDETGLPRIAVVGKPNAGKSTLINTLIGKERLVVSAVAGTTRDSIDTVCKHYDKRYLFIDTAGIRKKARIDVPVEYYSMVRTLQSIDRAQVVLILLDAPEGFTEQDQKILGQVHDAGKGAVILLNKWDLVEDKTEALKKLTREIRHTAWFMAHVPILTISALTRQRVTKLFSIVDAVLTETSRRIQTSELNRFIEQVKHEQSPPLFRHREVKVQYMTQVTTAPPGFAIFANHPEGLTPAYLRFVERRLRETFGFQGTPIRIFVKKKESDRQPRKPARRG